MEVTKKQKYLREKQILNWKIGFWKYHSSFEFENAIKSKWGWNVHLICL